jgi:hypothetical protein
MRKDDTTLPAVSRRTLSLGGLGMAAALAAPMGARADGHGGADDSWHTDPDQQLFNYLRVQGDLSGKPAPNPWRGHYIAVTPDDNPRIVFDCESCETKRVIARDGGRYEVWSKVMTVFKDPETGEILNGKTYRNPWTGEDNLVEPNIIGSRSLYFVEGGQVVSAMFARDTNAAEGTNWSAEIPASAKDALSLSWTVMGDRVQMSGRRKYPEKRPIPLAEYGTTTVDLAEILNQDLTRIEATYGIVFLAPWQGFLNMGSRPGHSVWHCVGSKAKSFDDLSPEYLEQAEKYIPDVLAWADA